MCIGYRALNQQMRPAQYPLPRIDDLLDWLVNAKCPSSFDLHIGYYQVAITPGDE